MKKYSMFDIFALKTYRFLFTSLTLLILLPVVSFADADRILKENSKAVAAIITYDEKGNIVDRGNGFIVRADGAIITNSSAMYKVLSFDTKAKQGTISEQLEVKVITGNETLKVEGLLYGTSYEGDGIVILKAEGKNLPTVKLEDTDKLTEGENVYIMGSSEGLECAISEGIFSKMKEVNNQRYLGINKINPPIPFTKLKLLVNSVFPVFNKNGKVVGVAGGLVGGQLAIPINRIKDKISAKKVTTLKDARIELYKTSVDYWMKLGIACLDSGMNREAVEASQQAIRINKEQAGMVYSSLPHIILGRAYKNLGRYKEAIETFKQAIRIDPDNEHAHCDIGVAYALLWMNREAMEAFKQAIRIKPDYILAHYRLGIIYVILSDRGSALEQYKTLKNLDPEKANELFNQIYE